eukprot:15448557-Alexandrium_andersonii.AAC.1
MAPASASSRAATTSPPIQGTGIGHEKEGDVSSLSSTEPIERPPKAISSLVHHSSRTAEELRQAEEERRAEAVALSLAQGRPVTYGPRGRLQLLALDDAKRDTQHSAESSEAPETSAAVVP